MPNKIPNAPASYRTINPFIITKDAAKVIEFCEDVFGGESQPDALTYEPDGLILHSEVRIGDSLVQVADRQAGWPYMPSLLQIYVDDLEGALAKAEKRGAVVITKPTEFLGAMFSRIKDAQGNMWWVYQYLGEVDWSAVGGEESESDSWEPTVEATYIHDTLLEAMPNMKDVAA